MPENDVSAGRGRAYGRSHTSLALALAWTVGAPGCAQPPLTPRSPTPGAPQLVVTSFNVHLHQWDDPGTVEAVGLAGADLIVLQETNPDWEQALRARYADAYPHMLFRHKGGGSGGLAVLSRSPVVDAGLRPYLDWHPAWHLQVQTKLAVVQVLAVHLRAPLNRNDDGALTALSNLGEDHRAEIKAFSVACEEELPTLVVGDFNEDPQGPAVAWLEDRGFRNALPLFRPGVETWRRRSLHGQTVETVDHVLFDDAFVPLDAWVERAGSSDHLPVTAHFEAAAHSAYR